MLLVNCYISRLARNIKNSHQDVIDYHIAQLRYFYDTVSRIINLESSFCRPGRVIVFIQERYFEKRDRELKRISISSTTISITFACQDVIGYMHIL